MKYVGRKTKEISFPLGGIGSGSIGLAGNGSLVDWDIFNRPGKGMLNGYSFFAVKAIKDGKPITYILNGDTNENLMGQYRKTIFFGFGYGPCTYSMSAFPHFRNVEFNGEFPMAELTFCDDGFPGQVKMTAFNPFIPGDEDNSSIPAAFFEIEIHNDTDKKITYQTALSLTNHFGVSQNKSETDGGCHVLFMKNAGDSEDSVEYGDMSIATDSENVYVQDCWYRGHWSDDIISFWNEFNSIENLKQRTYDDNGSNDVGTVAAELEIMPNERKKVRFVLSWNMPNNYNYWDKENEEFCKNNPWKNYYAVLFENSAASAQYALKNWENLYRRTVRFKEILHNSTLPREVIDAVSSNLSVLKSPTVLRLEDGSFYGWEGVHEESGSCEGTCQHVWNYTYAMCFLFPKLEKSIRDLEFKYSTAPDGRMGFRMLLPVGRGVTPFRACLDGQMGAVIKTYREWKLSGDNKWLEDNWENVKKVLEYAWSAENPDRWDRNRDGVLEGRQHHTLDMELFGPSSWLEGMYLAALAAAAEMAEFLGDKEKAAEYKDLFLKGQAWTKENLFNGKYFIQKVDLTDKGILDSFDAPEYWNDETGEIKYQIGNGSAIDQLLGQWHADILGLGDIFDRNQVSSALDEMMKNNYKPSMRGIANPGRVFSLNDDAGSVICDYPQGIVKPKIPVLYSEYTMTGFEYAFAELLIMRGKTADGFKVVRAVRDRFDGEKRNPWNEFECGSNYSRSMASYALIPIMSGFEFDLPNGYIGFNPYIKDGFKSIWSVDGAWGEIAVSGESVSLKIEEGRIKLSSFGVKFARNVSDVKIDGKKVDFEFKDGVIYFGETIIRGCAEITL